MENERSSEYGFRNATKLGRWVAGFLLRYDTSDVISFDQASIVDSLENHLDQIQKTIRWVLAVTLVISWSTIVSSTDVKIIGLEIPRIYVFYFASAYFVFVNTTMIVWFQRIGKLIQHLDGRFFEIAITKLSTHTLISNPFVFIGSQSFRKTEARRGLLLIISIWWIPNLSLMVLANSTDISAINMYIAQGIYLLVGLLSLVLILEIWSIVFKRLDDLNTEAVNGKVA